MEPGWSPLLMLVSESLTRPVRFIRGRIGRAGWSGSNIWLTSLRVVFGNAFEGGTERFAPVATVLG